MIAQAYCNELPHSRARVYARIYYAGISLMLSLFAHVPQASATGVDPLRFNLPSTAVEQQHLRTEQSATFKLDNGKFAAVSSGFPLFIRSGDQWIPIEETGVLHADVLLFNRLADNTRIAFDLRRPSYTLRHNGRFYTISFAGGGSGVVLPDKRGVRYRLADGVTLTWTVRGNQVEKTILVEREIDPSLFPFTVTASRGVRVDLKNGSLQFVQRNGVDAFTVRDPFLADANGQQLLNPVTIIQNAAREFSYTYDTQGLPLPYIIDPTSGPNSPGTIVSDSSAGTQVWTNPSNAGASDNSYAVANGSTQVSELLKATNFGFSIPSGSTIDGVEVNIERKCSTNSPPFSYCQDANVTLVKGGTSQGDNKATSDYWPTSDTTATYGGSSDLWNVTLSTSDVNASDFGATMNVLLHSGVSPP